MPAEMPARFEQAHFGMVLQVMRRRQTGNA
jgi:hypothetical protein